MPFKLLKKLTLCDRTEESVIALQLYHNDICSANRILVFNASDRQNKIVYVLFCVKI